MYLQNYLLQFPYVKNVAKLLFPPPFKQTLSQMLSSAYAKENILQWRSVLFLCLVTFVLLAQLKGATANCKAVYRQVLKVQAFLVQEGTGIKLSHRFFQLQRHWSDAGKDQALLPFYADLAACGMSVHLSERAALQPSKRAWPVLAAVLGFVVQLSDPFGSVSKQNHKFKDSH